MGLETQLKADIDLRLTRHQAIMVRKVCANMLFLKWSIEKNYKHSVVNKLLDDTCTERGHDDFTVEKANYLFKQYSTCTCTMYLSMPCLWYSLARDMLIFSDLCF